MCSVNRAAGRMQPRAVLVALFVAASILTWRQAFSADSPVAADPRNVPDADANTADQMKPYADVIANTDVRFDMLPIPGGKFMMGSPDSEAGHKSDEAPQHEVELDPFWMGKCEVTWNEYEIWMFSLDIQRRQVNNLAASDLDKNADAVTRPTKPYTDMTFGMGKDGYPAICMTQLAAKSYCKWLSQKTGRYYRLPTEAEWEYACRAGTKTAYSFGDDPAKLSDYAWYFDDSNDTYHKVGQKKANPWGLHDMHGNVAEWTLDLYTPDGYLEFAGKLTKNPLVIPKSLYPQAARGGSWSDDAELLRGAARVGSHRDWKQQDPQIPQSIWYFTDALFLGFRVVRPFNEPSAEEKAKYWEAGADK